MLFFFSLHSFEELKQKNIKGGLMLFEQIEFISEAGFSILYPTVSDVYGIGNSHSKNHPAIKIIN